MITRYLPVMTISKNDQDLDALTIIMQSHAKGAYVRYDEYRMDVDAITKEMKELQIENERLTMELEKCCTMKTA